MSAAGSAANPRWWVAGDWNGFFGLFTNVLLNVIVLTSAGLQQFRQHSWFFLR